MERLERDRLRELVRNEEWRSRMLKGLEMTRMKGEDELDGEETDMLVDYLCRLVPEPSEYPDFDAVFEEYLRNESRRLLEEDITISLDPVPKEKAAPPPEPEPEPETEPAQQPYAPWRCWKPEDWRRFLEDTGVGERTRSQKYQLCDQFDELLGVVKREQRRRERRRKVILWVVAWTAILQLGGICCGIVWRVSALVGDFLSLPTWTACGLLGLMGVLGVLAVAAVSQGLKNAKDSLESIFGIDDDDEEWYWDEKEEE